MKYPLRSAFIFLFCQHAFMFMAKGELPLSEQLPGTWVLVGTPEKVGEPPAQGAGVKVISGRRWLVTQTDPETGVVTRHGGTFTASGNEYSETVEYANDSTKQLIGKTFIFTASIKGDLLTILGKGNPWREVWKRVK